MSKIDDKQTFENRLDRLEKIHEQMKDSALPLDESMKLFEEGLKLAGSLEDELKKAEKRIEILTHPEKVTNAESSEPELQDLNDENTDAPDFTTFSG